MDIWINAQLLTAAGCIGISSLIMKIEIFGHVTKKQAFKNNKLQMCLPNVKMVLIFNVCGINVVNLEIN